MEKIAMRLGEEHFNPVVIAKECNAFLNQLQPIHPGNQTDGSQTFYRNNQEPWLSATNVIKLECFKSTMEFWSQF